MSKVNYYLKNVPTTEKLEILKKAKDKTYINLISEKRPIIMSIAYNGKRELFATGKFISLKLWDKTEQRIKVVLETTDNSIVDGEWLDSKKIEIEKFLRLAKQECHSVSKNELKSIISGQIANTLKEKTFEEIQKQFLKEHKTQVGTSLKNNTKKKYFSLFQHIKNFQNNNVFSIQQFTDEWLNDFKSYLILTVNVNDNTVCKYIKALKTFLIYLMNKGHKVPANLKNIRVTENEQLVIALREDELQLLENVVLNCPIHQKIRDIFLFHCYTGSRYSDIEEIKNVDIIESDGIKFWKYMSVKSQIELTAPIHKKAEIILKKYEGLDNPLPIYKNQFVNKQIKEIAKIAGLSRPVKKIIFRDGVKNENIFSLFETISTHIARKTFISISLQRGVDERKVRAVSGHRDERSFRRYIDLNNTALIALKEAWERN